ncbi:MAG TPA: hypothetical protein VFS08_16980 [Gemmatimonadaceae bacterium]|nr:hypothetical protein [Gemmatimonadaceae bacterium]
MSRAGWTRDGAPRRRCARRLAGVLLGLAAPGVAAAQGSLAESGTLSAGPLYETVRFGDGVTQPGLTADGDVVVRHASQWSVPFAATLPLGERWTFDLAGAYSAGEVTLQGDDPALGIRRYALRGMTDLRLRATGHLVGDNLLLTLGATFPTGHQALDREALSALRVLSAPALGFQMPGVSVGRGATAGLVLARQLGGWAWALGGSYELRGRYSPVQAFTAGIADPDFDPGDAVHLSLGTEGLVGQHAMTLSVAADLFTGDELRDGGGTDVLVAATRLGPVYTASWQLRLGTRRFRELTLYATDRYRTRYEQDGAPVAGSDGNYLDAGLRAVRPLGGRTDLLAGLQLRHQTGLDVDESLATAGAVAGGVTLGLSRTVGRLLVQPYVRAQLGRLEAGGERVSTSGFGGGIALGGRF